ncbi:murein biosynthesis integral membrane protein MurJ [Pelomonas sp. KK5]|uniref:murein biosynthesis integral membrane protein MurJ n=1 Tax=Pelomonas sp. KK5 TaxID=1855730 RepID=UPI00097BDF17|nr:murein biosynthesis integral membrane protein MurJ [Pelomonas sp. KK5]
MNLLRAASLISVLTLVSRILGLVREQMLAALFGASTLTDAYQVALRIPNLLRRLFAEGAFSQAFVPVLAAARARDGDEATHALIDAVATILAWVLALVCIVGVIGAPVLVWMLGAGLTDEGRDAAIVMTRWMFPYIGCISLVALAGGILNTWRRFMVAAVTPVLLNLSVIFAGWWLVPHMAGWGWRPIYALAIGVMIGGILQLLVQIPALARIGALPRPMKLSLAWQHPGVRRVLAQMAPALVGVGVAQLSLLINTQLALAVGVGAASWLTYADRLMEFPISLLGVALGAVLTPQLSAVRAKGEMEAYSNLLDWGLRLVSLLAVPCGVALVAFAKPMVAVLYNRGHFNAEDVMHTTHAVMGYGFGLLGLVAVKVLAPGFYASQDTRTPVRIAIAVLVVTQLLNLVFVPLLGVAGLALSIGLGAMINAGMLLRGLRKVGSYKPKAGWRVFLLRVAAASAAMGALQYELSTRLDWVAMGAHEGLRALALAGSLAASAALYFIVLVVCGQDLKTFLRRSA